jgi:hypothetical protein
MSAPAREYTETTQRLKVLIGRLIGAAEAADADSWGTDIFRRLLSYARAVSLDLDADLFRGPDAEEALGRLSLLGAELGLHQWTEFWPAATETALVLDTQSAAETLRKVVRARGAVSAGNQE